ncbi:MAG: dihydrolipoamide acetyltransferase family protein [Rhodospirillales bacterium]
MPKLMPITIPKWGIEMERGTIAEWRVDVGESVVKGDELVDIETDKIVNSFEATDGGVLVRIIAQEGEERDVGTLIGVMASEMVSDAEVDAFIASNSASDAASNAESESPAKLSADQQTPVASKTAVLAAPGVEAKISPALRRKAERLELDISTIAGSGYGGRILRDDIEAASSGGQAPSLRQLHGTQKTIAERMTLAKQTIPHFYLHRDCAMDNVLGALESSRADPGVSITVNHVLVRAVAQALEKHPELNLNVLPNGIKQLDSTDVAIAVDTGDSLLTPVVRDIGEATLSAVAEAAAKLVDRTRNQQLNAGDLNGGAVTVSNLGMLGVTSFTAIINPPQVMILAVGAIQERVILKGGKPVLARFCALTLACDHRVINGAAGARFLAAICESMEAAG